MDKLRAQLTLPRLAGASLAVAVGILVAYGKAPAGDSRLVASPASTAAAAAGEGGSPVSLDSALSLFRASLPRVDRLEHGERSMQALMERFGRTIAASDTSTLRALVMSRREFAYLYYPASAFMRAPTKQEPALAWFLHVQQSQKGATRLLNRFGGRPFRIVKNECSGAARVDGANTLWNDCLQTAVSGRDTVRMRLVGGIYERAGVYKVLSYANDM